MRRGSALTHGCLKALMPTLVLFTSIGCDEPDPTLINLHLGGIITPYVNDRGVEAPDLQFCGPRETVTGIVVKAGAAVDAIDIVCTDINDAAVTDPARLGSIVHTRRHFIAGTAQNNDFERQLDAPPGLYDIRLRDPIL